MSINNYTEEHLKALQHALATGTKSVTYDGQTIVYRDIDDLKAAISEVKRNLSNTTAQRPTRRVNFSSARSV